VGDGVTGDVGDMVIGNRVADFATVTFAGDEPGATQNPKS